MKNNVESNLKVYKYILTDIGYFLVSCIIATVLIGFIYNWVDSLYMHANSDFINKYVYLFMFIKGNITGDLIYLIIFISLTMIIYSILAYKRYLNIHKLVKNVEIMVGGNLDKRIEVKSGGEVRKVARNINNIVEQLRNITIEEKKAQQTKSDLITNVSHDLRTPLTSIIGYLNLIEEDKYKDEVELRYYINIVYEKAQSLNILIDDLFELTKMQNNTLTFNKIPINLNELISQIIYHLDYQFIEANVESRLSLCSEEILINADPLKLVRAFENLIINALKYGKDGYYVDIKIKKDEDTAIVQVINYGEAIPVVDLPNIFDRFYRVEKSRNKDDGGSGLGLAITKNIIENHDGSIFVESDNHKTMFEVKIKLI